MSNAPADSPAGPPPSGDNWLAEPKRPGETWLAESPPPAEDWLAGPKPPSEGWTKKKFFLVLAFVLVLHVALIFLFGTKKQIVPRAVTNVPHLQLPDKPNELTALSDPTLFVRPNAHDLVTIFWRHIPAVTQPNFTWTEDPRYLPPAQEDFGIALRKYENKNDAAEFPLNFKPEPKSIAPPVAYFAPVPQVTTMQISGELAQRRLLNTIELPSPQYNDVIDRSKVQVLVDTAGNVFSPVLLESCGVGEIDQRALQLARYLRFAPAPQLTFGEITFTWHTVPTNTIPATVP
jgi:hypothetical protein